MKLSNFLVNPTNQTCLMKLKPEEVEPTAGQAPFESHLAGTQAPTPGNNQDWVFYGTKCRQWKLTIGNELKTSRVKSQLCIKHFTDFEKILTHIVAKGAGEGPS